MLYQSNLFREDMKPSYAVNSNRPSSFRKLVNSKYSINRCSGLNSFYPGEKATNKKLMAYRTGRIGGVENLMGNVLLRV